MAESYKKVTTPLGACCLQVTSTDTREWTLTEAKIDESIAALEEQLAYWKSLKVLLV